jgi:hypothetical protein
LNLAQKMERTRQTTHRRPKRQQMEQSLKKPHQRPTPLEKTRTQTRNPRSCNSHPNKKRRNLRHRNPLRKPSEDGAERKTHTTPQRQRTNPNSRKQHLKKSTGHGSKQRTTYLRQNRQRLLRHNAPVNKQLLFCLDPYLTAKNDKRGNTN